MAGPTAKAGAHNAAGATETSIPSGRVSHIKHPESTDEVDAVTPATSIVGAVTRRVRPQDLSPHPVSLEIYGEQNSADLAALIAEHGVLEPLLVTPGNVVISGHRRRAACLAAGIPEVPVIIVQPADEDAAVDLLLAANAQRVKTNEQMAREASFRMRIEQEKARRRQVEAGISKLPAKSPEAGDAREIVAKQMGIGHKRVDQLVAVVEQLDKLDVIGDSAGREVVAKALKKSVNRAYNKVLVRNERDKLGRQPVAPPAASANVQPDGETAPAKETKADIIERIQDDLADGMEDWEIETLLAFEKVMAAVKADWFAANGKEVA